MKGELKMDVNDYLPLRDVVFNTLRQAILRGEMEPGERLMEIQLADKLGVSRTPIREAIRKLAFLYYSECVLFPYILWCKCFRCIHLPCLALLS